MTDPIEPTPERNAGYTHPLRGKKIALAVTGSIAAYKSVEIARLLLKRGAEIFPLMSASASQFLGAMSLSGICGRPVVQNMWEHSLSFGGEEHVRLGKEIDALLIAPATADILSRLASGRADDAITSLALCTKKTIFIAPSMHPSMWSHPSTQSNVEKLKEQGVVFLGPDDGLVASGDEGFGRLMAPEEIAFHLEAWASPKDLIGKKILISAGPTFEPIDPVRFLGNFSTGTMGFALAEAALKRGAHVCMVSGPCSQRNPLSAKGAFERIDVMTAEEMKAALEHRLRWSDVLIMAAAVADYRPSVYSAIKKKKDTNSASMYTIDCVQNADIIQSLSSLRGASSQASTSKLPLLIGFALETGTDGELLDYAKKKRLQKGVDLIVANTAERALGKTSTRAFIVGEKGIVREFSGEKKAFSHVLLDEIALLFSS